MIQENSVVIVSGSGEIDLLLCRALHQAGVTVRVVRSCAEAAELLDGIGIPAALFCETSVTDDTWPDIMKFAAEHTKECALMEECVRSGYGIFADGRWFPFDAKGNELAKTLIEKTQKKDHIKVTVEGTKHEGKIFVQKLTEAN